MALDTKQLEKIKNILLERRDAIVAKIAQSDAGDSEELGAGDPADQANSASSKHFELQMGSRDREALAEIDRAVRRIDAGTFGECSQCGESISEARMLAHPSTTLCIDCKAELESDKTRFPGREK